jgi:CcmD family protein
MMKKIYVFVCLIVLSTANAVFAQDKVAPAADTTAPINTTMRPDAKIEMADVLYQNGKIYLVVLVLLTIFAGIIFYLVRLDKKISKLEKE